MHSGKKSAAASTAENIRVVVRCRNLGPSELAQGHKQAVRLDVPARQVVVTAGGDPQSWTFDAVYNSTFTQRDLFLQEAKPLCDSLLQGFNATVFAYGQSGSGKSFTMSGKEDDDDESNKGIIPRCISYLFQEIAAQTTPTRSYKVKVQFIELYKAKAYDLLVKASPALDVRQASAASTSFIVKGATSVEVANAAECLAQFDVGTGSRRVASTLLNRASSRSHALFTLLLECVDSDELGTRTVVSKINMVDLAGSERAAKTGATGNTGEEGCSINLSLSALALVIEKTVKREAHIPYRSSPLTMLLKDSLGGNSKTVMFANCGPSDQNSSETISTLRFAVGVKQVKNTPSVCRDPKDARIEELLQRIADLEQRVGGAVKIDAEEALRSRVEELEVELTQVRLESSKDADEELKRLRGRLVQLESAVAAAEQRAACAEQASVVALADAEAKRHDASRLSHAVLKFLHSVHPPALESLPLLAMADTDLLARELNDFAASYTGRGVGRDELEAAVKTAVDEADRRQLQLNQEWEAERLKLVQQVSSQTERMTVESTAHDDAKRHLVRLQDELAALQAAHSRQQREAHESILKARNAAADASSDADSLRTQLATREREVEALRRNFTTEKHLTATVDGADDATMAELQRALIAKADAETEVAVLSLQLKSLNAPLDNDVVDSMVQHVRLQHQLYILRHNQQKQLAELLRKLEFVKTGKVTSVAVSAAREDELRRAWTAEMDVAKADMAAAHQVALDRLAAKLNRKEQELITTREEALTVARSQDEVAASLSTRLDAALADRDTQTAKIRQLEAVVGQLHASADRASLQLQGITVALDAANARVEKLSRAEADAVRFKRAAELAESNALQQSQALGVQRQLLLSTQAQLKQAQATIAELQRRVASVDEITVSLEAKWLARLADQEAAAVTHTRELLEQNSTRYELALSDERDKQRQLRRALKKAKELAQRNSDRYDEMVLENDVLMGTIERARMESMRAHRELHSGHA